MNLYLPLDKISPFRRTEMEYLEGFSSLVESKIYISSLEIQIISSLDIYIFKLEMHIFRLEIRNRAKLPVFTDRQTAFPVSEPSFFLR